jgi:hypothetical protein
MGKLKLKYILKYQQGGNIITTFSPQPRNFTSPIQGINPAVLQYDVRSAPIDMSQLTQVMQFNSNLRFQKEKNEKDLSLEREKLQFQKDKLSAELEAEWYKQVADDFKTAKSINKATTGTGIDDLDRMETSPFYLNQDATYKEQLAQYEEAYKKQLTGKPFDTKNLMERKNLESKLQSAASKLPAFPKLRADDRIHASLLDIFTNEKSDIKLHKTSFLDYNERRLAHRETGANTYQLGEGFKAMYSLDAETKNYEDILKTARKTYEEETTRIENGLIVSDKKVIAPSNEVAAKNAAASALNGSTFYYMDEMKMGGTLFGLGPEERKKALEGHFLNKFKEDDASNAAFNEFQSSSFKGQLPKEEKDKTVTFKYDVPGKSQVKDANTFLNSFGLDAGQKAAVGQALLKAQAAGIDTNDPFFMAKVANEVLASYNPETKASKGLSDEAVGRIKAEGEAAISANIRSKLNSNPVIKNMSEEDKRLAATFLANPALQDAYYSNIYYPKNVEPLFNKIKTGQINVHESLKGLNDNQLKYIIHHEGPTNGLYYLKYGKVSPNSANQNSQAELNIALPKLNGSQDLPFIQALKDKNLEGDYDSVYGGDIKSSAIGAYGVLFYSQKQQILDFINGNSDLVRHNIDLDVSADQVKDAGSVYELIGTTKVFNTEYLQNNPAVTTEKDESGREWLVVPKDENGQRAMVNLGLLDEDTIFGLSGSGNLFDIFADVKVSEVGESKVKGLTIKKSNNNIKIAVKGTRVATQKTEQKPLEATPAAEEKKKGNPFLEKQKDLLDSLGKVQVDLK